MIRRVVAPALRSWTQATRSYMTNSLIYKGYPAPTGPGEAKAEDALHESILADLLDPTKGVSAIAAGARIGFPSEMLPLQPRRRPAGHPSAPPLVLPYKEDSVRFRFSRRHCFTFMSNRYLDLRNPGALTELELAQYLAKQRAGEPLWWYVMVHVADGVGATKAVVRNASRYKMGVAFRRALADAGCDETGRRMGGTSPRGEEGVTPLQTPVSGAATGPYGTLGIVIRDPFDVLEADMDELVKVLGRVLETMEPKERVLPMQRQTNGAGQTKTRRQDRREPGTRRNSVT